MELVQFSDPREFRDRSWPLLLGSYMAQDERENTGLCHGWLVQPCQERARLASKPWHTSPVMLPVFLYSWSYLDSVGGEGRPAFWAVEDKGRVEAAAVITPPHRLILTRASAQGFSILGPFALPSASPGGEGRVRALEAAAEVC